MFEINLRHTKEKKTRKRLRNETIFEKNITKRLKNEGKEYISSEKPKKWGFYEMTSADLSTQKY